MLLLQYKVLEMGMNEELENIANQQEELEKLKNESAVAEVQND